jgi:predicted DCC family thiol-disulfide oxidoreductase YuxK
MQRSASHPVIYFDGNCNLCNGFAEYVLRHDRKGMFRFSALQSDYARNRKFEIPANTDGSFETVLVEYDGKVLKYSEGVLKVFELLGGLHRLAAVFRILPRKWRDAIYRWMSRRRYMFFGKRDACKVPSRALQGRLLH